MTFDRILGLFRLGKNAEDPEAAMGSIHSAVSFRGTNIIILVFAIIIASVGLNTNSAAVIIGAMLISPLMGPIVGVGAGLGIMDLDLVRRGLKNLGFAVLASLLTSAAYFLVSPLEEAHSEILARTSPTIWDVLIAVSGGFAGIVATASRQKGNVVPGVAIATALMPPLCTAGYGLAHQNWPFFFGAFYLFLINSVFISIAALFTVRWLGYPTKTLMDKGVEQRVKRLVGIVVILTVVPSVWLAYRLVGENVFQRRVADFVAHETSLNGNYLAVHEVDAKRRKIKLTYVGAGVDSTDVERMRGRLPVHGLDGTTLEIRAGLSLAELDKEVHRHEDERAHLLEERAALRSQLDRMADSLRAVRADMASLLAEARAEHPLLLQMAFSDPAVSPWGDPPARLVVARFVQQPDTAERGRLVRWLRVRLRNEPLEVLIEAPDQGPSGSSSRKRPRK